MRIVQISDTHLSPTKRHFEPNWAPTAQWVRDQTPDLVVHTGDVSLDGADLEEDMAFSAARMKDFDRPFLAIPGNHDVGDAGNRHQPVNAERRARWVTHFGPDRWVEDAGPVRLVGFNALLIDSGEDAEYEQRDWLAEVTASAAGRSVLWFLHKPLFLESREEGDTGYWSVKPGPRPFYLDLVDRHGVAVVASGHLHRTHLIENPPTRFVWGPSSGFVCGPKEQPDGFPGAARLGAVVYDVAPGGITITRHDLTGLHPYVIDDVLHEVYPPRG